MTWKLRLAVAKLGFRKLATLRSRGRGRGYLADSLEEVVVDIEEAIKDELNFIATIKAKDT